MSPPAPDAPGPLPAERLAHARARAAGATRDPGLRDDLLDALGRHAGAVRSVSQLAVATGLSEHRVDTELAAAFVDRAEASSEARASGHRGDVLRLHVAGWSYGPPGVFERLREPGAFQLERWVHDGDHASLDAALASTGARPPRGVDSAPPLRWASGAPLSIGAQAWVLTQLLAGPAPRRGRDADGTRPVRGAIELVSPALDPPSAIGCVQWMLDATLPPSVSLRAPPVREVIDWLASQADAGEVSRSRALAMMGVDSVQARRWAFVWGELRSPRYPDVISDERIEGQWPVTDDPTGSLERWSVRIAQVLERAMIEQRRWELGRFREDYVAHPTAAPLVAGLVFMVGEEPTVFVDGRPRGSSGRSEPGLRRPVRVAHPTEWNAAWPSPVVAAPFGQRTRPVYGANELPAPPPASIPHRAWKHRLRALRWVSDEDSHGATRAELWLLERHRVCVRHAGYGTGLGGARPIEDVEVTVLEGVDAVLARLGPRGRSGWERVPPWLTSEVVISLRILFGLLPLPARDLDDGVAGRPWTGAGSAR